MPTPTVPDDPDDEGIELTRAQRKSLRESTGRLSRLMMSTIDLPAFASPEMRIKSFIPPESPMKKVAAITSIADFHFKILDTFKPLFTAQDAWSSQFSVLNSDALKTAGLGQTDLSMLSGALGKTIDFGISDTVSKLGQQFAAQQSAWLKNIGPFVSKANWTFYPPNLDDLEGLKIEQVESVALADGIPLYGVPRTAIAEALINADSTAKRRDILGRRSKSIMEDCRIALDGCDHEAVAAYVPFARAAVEALDAGHTEAAQALTGSLVDALITAYLGKEKKNYRPDRNGLRKSDDLKKFTIREFVAFAPMWQAYQQYWVDEGDTVPNTYSRNATAHTVSRRQFTKRNAVQGLMFACGLIYFFDGEAKRIDRTKEGVKGS